MAIYHCSIKIISRSGGRSAVACAAYRAGEKLYDKETGTVQDYTNKSGVILSEIKLPEDVPEYLRDRETLWNEVQLVEKQKDAQLAREIEVAFPKEFDRCTQMICAWNFINENFTSKGMIADWALHDKGDGNPHAHIMLTVREVDANGKWKQKQKSVFANARDENGTPIYDPDQPSYDLKNKKATAQYRIPDLDENGNQKVRIRKGKGIEKLWVRISVPVNDWNDRSKAEEWRASWAKCCNRYLEKDKQIDHRSYARQGKEEEPTIHEGVTARKMERSGRSAERCEINRNIKSRNRFLEGIRNLSKEIKEFIYEKVRPVIEGIRRCTQFTKGQGSYYFSDPFVGTKQQSIGRETEKSRETAERIKHFKRNTEQTDRDIAVTDRYLENAFRNDEIYKRNIRINKPDVERPDYHLEEAERFVTKGCQVMIEEEKHPVKETEVQKTNTAYRPILNTEEYVPRL